MLEAVVSLTALEGRMESTVAVRTIAERARLHPKNAARALGRLRDRDVIDYTPGRGRGNLSTVALRDPDAPSPSGTLVTPAALAMVAHRAPAADAGSEATFEAAPAVAGPSVRVEPAEAEKRELREVAEAREVAELRELSAARPASLPARTPELVSPARRPSPVAQPSSDEERLAAEVLSLFNAAAATHYTYREWGGLILERVRERPRWRLEQWADVIERAFAVAWWTRKLPDGEAPTPLVVFSSARQVESSLNVPDRLLRQASAGRQ